MGASPRYTELPAVLYAFASAPVDEVILDPRFTLVTRGVAPYWQQLAGRWACSGYDTSKYATPADAMAAGNTYGQKIKNIYDRLVATEVSEEELNTYFKVEVSETLPPVDSTVKVDDQKATNIATLIFNTIKKLLQLLVEVFNKSK